MSEAGCELPLVREPKIFASATSGWRRKTPQINARSESVRPTLFVTHSVFRKS
jgi:hypothetical protein